MDTHRWKDREGIELLAVRHGSDSFIREGEGGEIMLGSESVAWEMLRLTDLLERCEAGLATVLHRWKSRSPAATEHGPTLTAKGAEELLADLRRELGLEPREPPLSARTDHLLYLNKEE